MHEKPFKMHPMMAKKSYQKSTYVLHVPQTPKPEAHDPSMVPPLLVHSSLEMKDTQVK